MLAVKRLVKCQLGRSRRRWEDITKGDQEVSCEDARSMELAEATVVADRF
jgi:hypothetical protein